MQPRYFAVAEVGAPHGLAGEASLIVLTDFPERLLEPTSYLLSPPVGGLVEVRVDRVRGSGRLYAHFEGLDSPEAVAALRGCRLLVPEAEARSLDEDAYWVDDLVGCAVATTAGRELGTVEEVLFTGANDVYMVRLADGKSLPVPAIKEVVVSVDIEARSIVIEPIPGLMDLAH